MIRRTLVVLAASFAAVALSFAPVEAATYSVTSNLSKTQADVGQSVTISGTVSGAYATGRTVEVQRRVGTGSWTTIARPKTSSSRKYSVSHRVTAVGAQQFRAVVRTYKSTKQGLSSAKSFTGWKWLWLDQQPLTFRGHRIDTHQSPPVNGVKRPRSIRMSSGGSGRHPSAVLPERGVRPRRYPGGAV